MDRVWTGCLNSSVVKKLGKYVAEARAALPAMPWGLRMPEGATFGKRELGVWLTTRSGAPTHGSPRCTRGPNSPTPRPG